MAFFWGIMVLFSFIGFGRCLSLILAPKKIFDLGVWAALGLVFNVIVGGFLNLAGVISLSSVRILVFVGIALFLFFLIKNCLKWPTIFRRTIDFVKTNKAFVLAVFFVSFIILVRYCFAVAFFSFHGADDQHGYLAFPAKMLQTGSLGNDPFSERRIESSLGGQYFLHTIILAQTSFKNLHTTDSGLGFLIFVLLVVGFLIEKKVNRNIIIGVVLFVAVIVSPVGNITAAYTAASMFFLYFRFSYYIAESKGVSVFHNAMMIALPLATLCTLKSTFISVSAILFVLHYFFYYNVRRNYRLLTKEICLALIIIVVVLLPWMFSMFVSSGTLLYPIFGRGYQGFEHVIKVDIYSLLRLCFVSFESLITLIPLAAIGIFTYNLVSSKERNILWVIFLSGFSGVLVLIILIGGYSLYYYSFPYLLPSIIFVISVSLAGDLHFRNWPNFDGKLVGLVLTVFLFGSFLQRDLPMFQDIKDSLNIDNGKLKIGLMNSEIVNEDEMKQYVSLQQSIPIGETIISRLDRNFLFDFKRNNVFINDTPGGSSLPPGIPLNSGSEAMSDYFLSNNIKYIAYSYGNEANFSRGSVSGMLLPHVNPLLRAIAEKGLAFQDYVMELSKIKKVVYDDGKNLVLDLSIKIDKKSDVNLTNKH